MSRQQHLDTLGLPPEAGKPEIKAAFRRLAFKCHPDLNPSSGASAEYQRIAQATEALLGEGLVRDIGAQQAGRRSRSAFERMTSNPRFPLYFSAASLLLGCAIFAGAFHLHSGLYGTYGVHDPNAGPLQRTEEQQHIAELLQERVAEKRAQKAAQR